MDKIRDKNYFLLFLKNRFLSVLFTSIIPLILVSGIILYQFYQSYKIKNEDHLATLVKKHKVNIDSFLNEKLGNIRFIAESYSFERLTDFSFLEEELMLLQKEYSSVFVDLGIIDSEGIQVAYAGPFNLGKADYSSAGWFKKAMDSSYYLSDVFLGLRGLPHFIITVRTIRDSRPWLLRATIDFVAFNDLVENIRIGETGFAFILNRKGEFQTRPLYNVNPEEPPYTGFLNYRGPEEIQFKEYKRDNLEKNIYVAAFLKGGDWLLVCQQMASDAFSVFFKALNITLIIILTGSIATVLMAYARFKNMSINVERSESEKRLMNEQIIETGKLASVGELAAGIAHEINNPVAIMVEEAGWMEDLLADGEEVFEENQDEFKRSLRQIRTQGQRCKEITRKLLSFARKTDSRVQKTQLNELIEEIVAISEQRARYANVELEIHLSDIPEVDVSQTELQQVFLNIINNALDAMDKKGGLLKISSRLEKDFIVIEITDNGPGIPAPDLQKIFDPFFTTKPVGKGTGLGLSICYGIIKNLGGEIVVQSSLGAGASFFIKIPLSRIST